MRAHRTTRPNPWAAGTGRGWVPAAAAIAAVLATLAVAGTAGARSSFTGNVCGLVSAKQVATIPGLSTRCTRSRSAGLGSTIFTGNWAARSARGPRLQVTISVYRDQGALRLAKRNLAQGLPGGTPRKVTGIGTAAFEATGAGAIGIQFAVGKDIVYVTLTPIGKARSAALEAIARAIASRL